MLAHAGKSPYARATYRYSINVDLSLESGMFASYEHGSKTEFLNMSGRFMLHMHCKLPLGFG
jgi:hypothetical protein